MRTVKLLLVIVLAAGMASGYLGVSQAEEHAETWVCPPCGCSEDGVEHTETGSCSACGMARVAKSSLSAQSAQPPAAVERKRAAILIFNGVQIIDYTGPYEVFGQAGFDTFTVAEQSAPIRTAMNMTVTPAYTLETAPQPDIIVIPGGDIQPALTSPAVIKWIQESEKAAQFVLSVCNGAFILAKTGLLDGLSTTTFYGLIEDLRTFAPKTRVLDDRRYVDNGKFISTAGISSGIDGSLYVVSKFYGAGRAQMVALNMEYNWNPDSGYARAAFADRHIRRIFGRNLSAGGTGISAQRVLATQGDRDRWEVRWELQSEKTAEAVLSLISQRLREGGWTPNGEASAATGSAWTFSDEAGMQWRGAFEIKAVEPGRYTVNLRIGRTGKEGKARAAAPESGQPVVKAPWVREVPAGQRNAAAYLRIENPTVAANALVGAETISAAAVELHTVETAADGMMRMRRVDRIALPAGGSAELKPGGLHIMLIGLNRELRDGDEATVTLLFADSTRKTVVFPVRREAP